LSPPSFGNPDLSTALTSEQKAELDAALPRAQERADRHRVPHLLNLEWMAQDTPSQARWLASLVCAYAQGRGHTLVAGAHLRTDGSGSMPELWIYPGDSRC